MKEAKIEGVDLRIFFIIMFGGVLGVYTPIVCSIVGKILGLGGFWDVLKTLPYFFQIFIMFSMFLGLGVISKSVHDVIQYMMDYLFGKDEEIIGKVALDISRKD